MPTRADGDHVCGTALSDFVAASISPCFETEQASAVYFWWTSKGKTEGYQLRVLKSMFAKDWAMAAISWHSYGILSKIIPMF